MVDPAVQVPRITMAQNTSSFTTVIRCAILPQNFKIPYIECYEERIDPVGHLLFYCIWMEFEAAEDIVLCRVFPLTLGEAARA